MFSYMWEYVLTDPAQSDEVVIPWSHFHPSVEDAQRRSPVVSCERRALWDFTYEMPRNASLAYCGLLVASHTTCALGEAEAYSLKEIVSSLTESRLIWAVVVTSLKNVTPAGLGYTFSAMPRSPFLKRIGLSQLRLHRLLSPIEIELP